MNGGIRRSGWDECVARHVNAPGQGGVDSIIAVSGGETADAADAVADGRSGSGEIEDAQTGLCSTEPVGTQGDALSDERGDPGNQTAKPGKAGFEPGKKAKENVSGAAGAGRGDLAPSGSEFVWIFKFVPKLGADDAGYDREDDDVEPDLEADEEDTRWDFESEWAGVNVQYVQFISQLRCSELIKLL